MLEIASQGHTWPIPHSKDMLQDGEGRQSGDDNEDEIVRPYWRDELLIEHKQNTALNN